MKICYLADANNIHTKKMCEYFANKGYDVSVISLNDGEIPNVKVYSMKVETLYSGSAFSKIHYLGKLKRIKKIVKEINPDILHAHYASSYGLIAALINFKPTILSVWGSDVYDFPKESFINKEVLKYNLKKADCILSTSYVMKRETEKYSNKDIIVTPFGVDIERFKPSYKKSENNNIIIGTIKTLEEKYGLEYLIRAFRILVDKNKDKSLK